MKEKGITEELLRKIKYLRDNYGANGTEIARKFRDYHSNARLSCKDRHLCYGGCPITPSINLCDREERIY